MAVQTFKLGDQVKLNSGGPTMTVNDINSYKESFQVSCTWFYNSKLEDGLFIQESLRLFDPETDDRLFL